MVRRYFELETASDKLAKVDEDDPRLDTNGREMMALENRIVATPPPTSADRAVSRSSERDLPPCTNAAQIQLFAPLVANWRPIA
jgi:hypothetical protein